MGNFLILPYQPPYHLIPNHFFRINSLGNFVRLPASSGTDVIAYEIKTDKKTDEKTDVRAPGMTDGKSPPCFCQVRRFLFLSPPFFLPLTFPLLLPLFPASPSSLLLPLSSSSFLFSSEIEPIKMSNVHLVITS